jgi:hypothetical protein
MAVYAYRWADGSVSVCSAANKEEAAWLFDEVGPVSRKLIMKLKGQILVTTKLDVDKGWQFDADSAFGEDLDLEIPRSCYPHYHKAFGKIIADEADGKSSPDGKRKLIEALRKDYAQAADRIRRMPHMPDEFNLNPEGFPGQNN